MKFFGALGHGPRNSGLDFGGDLEHDPDTAFFKGYMYSRLLQVSFITRATLC